MPWQYFFSQPTWPLWATFVGAGLLAFASIYTAANQAWTSDEEKIHLAAQTSARDEAISSFMADAIALAQREVRTKEEFSQLKVDVQNLFHSREDRLGKVLTPAQMKAIFTPGVNSVAFPGSFNEAHDSLRGTLYRWSDMLRTMIGR